MKKDISNVFLDLQGYHCSFGYVPKELAAYDGVRISNYLFKPPFCKSLLSISDAKTVQWAEDYHGIEWETGNIEIEDLKKILKHILKEYKEPTIFVKGTEKINFIKKFLNKESVIPMDNPILSKSKKPNECYFHKNFLNWHCAATNVKILYNYKMCANKD